MLKFPFIVSMSDCVRNLMLCEPRQRSHRRTGTLDTKNIVLEGERREPELVLTICVGEAIGYLKSYL